jgi:hypothetical protein
MILNCAKETFFLLSSFIEIVPIDRKFIQSNVKK